MNTLTRWNQNNELSQMRNMMDRLFEDFASNFSLDTASRPFAAPPLDIIEHEEHVEIRADLPGIDPENVNIEFRNGSLVISAHTESETTETNDERNYTRRERYTGSYHRALSMPDTLDVQNAEANFENGVLVLALPRKPESKPMRIPINGKKTIENKSKK